MSTSSATSNTTPVGEDPHTPLAVPHQLGHDVFVGGRVLEHRGHVNAALVCKRTLADEGLIVPKRQIRLLGDERAERGQARQPFATDRRVPVLQLEVGDDRGQVHVATAFAVAVHAALHVRGAGLDGGERVGDGQVRVVVGMDTDGAAKPLPHRGHDFGEQLRRRAAVRVAQAQHRGSGRFSGRERVECVARVGPVAIEEVLGVVDHLAPVAPEECHRLADEGQVLVEADTEGPEHVQLPRLAEHRDSGGLRLDQRQHARVLVHRELGHARGAEGHEPGVFQAKGLRAGEEFLVFRVRPRPAPFDVVDAELIELLRDDQLVVNGEGDVLSLSAIPERGIEGLDSHHMWGESPPHSIGRRRVGARGIPKSRLPRPRRGRAPTAAPLSGRWVLLQPPVGRGRVQELF